MLIAVFVHHRYHHHEWNTTLHPLIYSQAIRSLCSILFVEEYPLFGLKNSYPEFLDMLVPPNLLIVSRGEFYRSVIKNLVIWHADQVGLKSWTTVSFFLGARNHARVKNISRDLTTNGVCPGKANRKLGLIINIRQQRVVDSTKNKSGRFILPYLLSKRHQDLFFFDFGVRKIFRRWTTAIDRLNQWICFFLIQERLTGSVIGVECMSVKLPSGNSVRVGFLWRHQKWSDYLGSTKPTQFVTDRDLTEWQCNTRLEYFRFIVTQRHFRYHLDEWI